MLVCFQYNIISRTRPWKSDDFIFLFPVVGPQLVGYAPFNQIGVGILGSNNWKEISEIPFLLAMQSKDDFLFIYPREHNTNKFAWSAQSPRSDTTVNDQPSHHSLLLPQDNVLWR